MLIPLIIQGLVKPALIDVNESLDDIKDKAPIISIDRHRTGSDGIGITTLVGFYGCPLKCKSCLNPECHNEPKNYMSPEELFDKIKIDDIYFRSSSGGVTFGGGEPLLFPDFIKTFAQLSKVGWAVNIETSLNVPLENLKLCAEYISCFIIDLKCITNSKYIEYTGKSNKKVLRNLQWLAKNVETDRIVVRVPIIPNVTDEKDIIDAVDFINNLGISKIEKFKYILPDAIDSAKNERMSHGKSICEVLKALRSKIAKENGLKYETSVCTYDGPCTGSCPKCDAELQNITTYLNILENNNVKVTI